jgi:hypothetical protein
MTMTTRTGLTALALTASILAADGCGGGSKGPSRAEFILQADPICARANEALRASNVSPQNLPRTGPHVATFYQQAANELAKLTPPPSMAADWKVIVDSTRRTAAGFIKWGEAATASKKFNRAWLEAEGEITKGQHDRTVIALHDGFQACNKI